MAETESGHPPAEPLGYMVIHQSGRTERTVPIFDQLFVGRECPGIAEARRLVISDPEVSRNHLEIRLDAASDQAYVIDISTNGTLLNSVRLERAVPHIIKPGDEIRVGEVGMTFVSTAFTTGSEAYGWQTSARISQSVMVMVVGVITNYGEMSEVVDHTVMAEELNHLWRELGVILRSHRGTLSHYAGEELYATWELKNIPGAEELAVDFALAANERVNELGPELALRGPDDSPIRTGWGVVKGMAALAAMTRSVEAVIGDTTNLAFRIANLAARDGRGSVMVNSNVHAATRDLFSWGDPEDVPIKGRSGLETIYPALERGAGDASPPIMQTTRIGFRPRPE